MQADHFQPPNLQTLSENVIGHVVLRRADKTNNIHVYQNQEPECQFLTETSSSLSTEEIERRTTRLHHSATSNSTRVTDGRISSTGSSQEYTSANPSHADQMRASLAAYHRERRRKNQERYRAKKRQLTIDLEIYNHELQEEIHLLERKHDILSARSNLARNTVWSVAAEYFRVFRRGLLAPEGTSLIELDFLKATMAPDLEAGTFRGLAALARNWNAFTLFFQDVQIRLGRLDEIAENSLVATTTTSITITRNSLCYIFPHLMRHGLDRGEGGNQWSHIASSLLNRRIVMSGSVHFNWDSANKRVVGLFTQADMVSPLLHLLGSLEDISRIFTNALIDPECNLIDMKYLDKYKVW